MIGLTADVSLALELLAVSEDGLTAPQLGALLAELGPRKVKFTKPALDRLLEAPVAQGLVRPEHRMLLREGEGEPIVRRLIREGRYRALCEAISKHDPLQTAWYYGRQGVIKREMRLAILASDWARYVELYRLHPVPIVPMLIDPFEADMLRGLRGNLATYALDKLSSWSLSKVRPIPGLLELTVEMGHAMSQEPFGVLAGVRCSVLAGRMDLVEELMSAAKDPLPSLVGLVALVEGRVKAAVTGLAKQLATERARHHRRDIVFDGLEGALLPLAYLLEGSENRVKQGLAMIDLVRKDLAKDVHGLHAGWLHLAWWKDPSQPAPPSGHHPLAVWMEGLARSWSSLPLDASRIEEAAQRAEGCGWMWVAAELRALLGGGAVSGTIPLVTLAGSAPPWQTQLAAIEAALAGAEQRQSRVAWFVQPSPLIIEPREQLRQRSGWSAGKKVGVPRLMGRGKKIELTDADLRVVRTLRQVQTWRGSEYEWTVPEVFQALHGHPHVYTMQGDPLTIALLRPRVQVRRSESEIELSVLPSSPEGSAVVEVVGDRGVEVTAFDARQAEVTRRFSGTLKLPASESERLDGLLERLSELFEIVDTGSDGQDRSRPGDPAPIVQLWPDGSTVAARVVVRPVGEHGPALQPGAGAPVVLALVEGKPQRAQRDLPEEERRATALLQAIPALVPPLPWGSATLPDLPSVLSVLEALTAYEPKVALEWPQGATVRLRASAGSRAMNVSVRKAGDWFSASGELVVDEGLSLPLPELLERVSASSGRFVQLDDGSYLALTDKLRHQLDAMARVAKVQSGKVEVHPLAAELLSDLVEAAGRSRVDTAFREHLVERAKTLPDPAVPVGLRAELRPYQVEGFRWLARHAHLGTGACLADDMGLGKTVMTLALLLHRAAAGPALVVAPTSVCAVWRGEAWRFAPDLRLVEVPDGATAATLPDPVAGDVVVCSYGLLVNAADRLSSISWATVIADEAQAIKNAETQRHKALSRMGGAFRLALTGTPVENHLGDLWSLFAFLNPGLLGSATQFARRFQGPLEAGESKVQQQLHRLVGPFILRRTKAAVLSDLPERTVIDRVVDLGPEHAALYEGLRKEALVAVQAGGQDAVQLLAQLTRLRLAACHPRLVVDGTDIQSAKLAAFGEMVEALTAGRHRALVFSQFVRHLQLVREVLDASDVPYQYLDGETPAKERQRRVEAFQKGEGLLFLISLRAGGFGLNLTAADYVVHLDPWWNPAVEDQASDRAHRIGQTRPVTVYRIVARGTIEERILELHRTKRDLADRLLAGSDAAGRLTAEEMLALLQER